MNNAVSVGTRRGGPAAAAAAPPPSVALFAASAGPASVRSPSQRRGFALADALATWWRLDDGDRVRLGRGRVGVGGGRLRACPEIVEAAAPAGTIHSDAKGCSAHTRTPVANSPGAECRIGATKRVMCVSAIGVRPGPRKVIGTAAPEV